MSKKQLALEVGKEVGLIFWVSDDGEYFMFAEHENMSSKLIEFAELYNERVQSCE